MLRRLEQSCGGDRQFYLGFVAACSRGLPFWERSIDPRLRRIELTPFNENIIENLLRAASKALSIRNSDEWYRSRSKEVLVCSAGHPGCIAAIVQHFYDNYGVTPDLNDNLVFVNCVEPVIDTEILTRGNITGASRDAVDPDRLTRVLIELSLYRFITRPHIEAVVTHLGLRLDQPGLAQLEEEIRACPLIERDKYFPVLRLPYSIRRLLERKLTIYHPGHQLRHQTAAALYEEWLGTTEETRARSASRGLHQIYHIQEYLYHQARGIQNRGDGLLDELRRMLHDQIAYLRPSLTFEEPYLRSMLADRLRDDKELRTIVDDRVKQGAYEYLLSEVRP
jgi:hypothetical protein